MSFASSGKKGYGYAPPTSPSKSIQIQAGYAQPVLQKGTKLAPPTSTPGSKFIPYKKDQHNG